MTPDPAVGEDVTVLENIVSQEVLDLEGAEQEEGAELVQEGLAYAGPLPPQLGCAGTGVKQRRVAVSDAVVAARLPR